MALLSGRTVVTTAGTKVKFSTTAVSTKRVVITPFAANTKAVTVGGTDVVGSLAGRKGAAVPAAGQLILDVDDLTDLYLDAEVNGEGASWLANDIVR